MAFAGSHLTRRYEVDVQEVAYHQANGEPLLARILQPRGEGPFPALLYLHGGVWTNGDRTGNPWIYEPLAAEGMVVFSVDFRQAPHHPYPEPLQDINYAVRWVKVQASNFNADPATLGAMGTSSGGHHAMLTAMRPSDPRYAGPALPAAPEADATLQYVVACWAILDPFGRYLFAEETNQTRLVTQTEGYFRTQAAMQEGNPTMILERGEQAERPPVIIIQGTADLNVRPEMQERFAAAYRAAGGECDLHVFQDMPHGTMEWPAQEAGQAIDLITKFIATQLAR